MAGDIPSFLLPGVVCVCNRKQDLLFFPDEEALTGNH